MQSNVVPHTIMLCVVFFIMIPAAIAFLNSNIKYQHLGIFAGMFLFILSPQLGINYMADHEYVKGTTQAFEISIVDFFAIIYFVLLLMKKDYKMVYWIPGTSLFIFYLVMSCISCINSPVLLYSYFEIFRLIKMAFFLIVMHNMIVYYNCYPTIIKAFSLGLIMNLGLIIFQRYVLGAYAAIGLMKHKNNAGMYVNQLMPIYLYLALNVNFKSKFTKMYFVGIFFVCAMSVIVTMSRTAWGISAMTIIFIMGLSFTKGINREKIAILCITIFGLIAGLIKSYDTLYERISIGNESGTQGRKSLIINAADMANKNFFGVGINNYTEANTFENNYGDIFTNLKTNDEDRKIGKVETIYMLTAGEIGWVGLFSLLCWFLYYLYLSFRNMLFYRKSNMAYLGYGLFISLLGAELHSIMEWILRYSQNFYLLIMVFAMITAMNQFRIESQKKGIKVLQA